MGCNVREKHGKNNRRGRSMKPSSSDVDHNHFNDKSPCLPKSVLESEVKPWTYNVGFDENDSKINNYDDNLNYGPANSSNALNPGFEEGGWGYCTEEQLKQILYKQMHCVYNEAVSKLVGMGYDEEVALKAILKNGHFHGPGDVLSNIIHNSLMYLTTGHCTSQHYAENVEFVFNKLRQIEQFALASMVCMLQQSRPNLSRGDAFWCLIMSDLDVGRASTIEIPKLPEPIDVSDNGMSNMESANDDTGNVSFGITPEMCKFHEGWGFGGNGPNSEAPPYSEASILREIDSAKRFNLSPTMKAMLSRNVASFAAGFRSKQKLQYPQVQCQPFPSIATTGDSLKATLPAANVPNEVCEGSHDNNQEDVLVLEKFRDLNIDGYMENMTEDQEDEVLLSLMNQVKELEKQVSERKDWAHQKAMQAARKLSNDLTELKVLRMERGETQKLKNGKQILEDTTMKKLSEMETALRKASSQVDRANAAVRQLEIENAETRAEMEASKLSASESMKTCLEIAKREKKCSKRLAAWEKQKTKLQEELVTEKQKIFSVQQELGQINAAQKKTEAKLRQKVKDKELAMALVEEERWSKEATEANSKRNLEALRLRIDIDFQRHKDDVERLQQELARLKASSEFIEPDHPLDVFTSGYPETAKHQAQIISSLLQDLDEAEREGSERDCIICMKDEVSVVFLPCAHQVMCVGCGENYGKNGKAICPCCQVPIEERIRVFGASC